MIHVLGYLGLHPKPQPISGGGSGRLGCKQPRYPRDYPPEPPEPRYGHGPGGYGHGGHGLGPTIMTEAELLEKMSCSALTKQGDMDGCRDAPRITPCNIEVDLSGASNSCLVGMIAARLVHGRTTSLKTVLVC